MWQPDTRWKELMRGRERQKPQDVLLHPVSLRTGHFVVIIQTDKNSQCAWRGKKRKSAFTANFSILFNLLLAPPEPPPSNPSITAARFDFVLVHTSSAAALLLPDAISFSSVRCHPPGISDNLTKSLKSLFLLCLSFHLHWVQTRVVIWEFLHTKGRSPSNKLDTWKLRMATNMVGGSYSLLITETCLYSLSNHSQHTVGQTSTTGQRAGQPEPTRGEALGRLWRPQAADPGVVGGPNPTTSRRPRRRVACV